VGAGVAPAAGGGVSNAGGVSATWLMTGKPACVGCIADE
jgi:hypothetical protein